MQATELYESGEQHREQQEWEPALRCYERMLAVAPDHFAAWRGKAFVLRELDRRPEALECVKRALEINPDYVLGWRTKGALLRDLGHDEEGLSCYERALELDPDDPLLWRNKAGALRALGRLEDAALAFQRSRELDPTQPSPLKSSDRSAAAPTDLTTRSIRVFVSSTFRDMRAEREELVKRVFPQLRKLCEQRNVNWTDVDLRWGVTDEQKAEGHALPICLAEIQRCRPYFIGLLGDRYGPPVHKITPEVLDREPWLREQLDRSLTELEILHGVLRNPEMAEHAFFYFRNPSYMDRLPAEADPADFRSENAVEVDRLRGLKKRIRGSGFPVRENYSDPVALGQLVLADFTALINSLYPEASQPSPLDREAMDQEFFAASRARVYVRRQDYFDRLDAHAAGDGPPLVITGASGMGKSALLANWAVDYRDRYPEVPRIMHFTSATPASTDWATMVRRILAELNRRCDLKLEIPERVDALRQTFANALYQAAAHSRVVLVVDALNQLEDRDGALDLVWLPPELPANMRLVVSTLPGRPLDDITRRGWPQLTVEPLTKEERLRLIYDYLAQYTKTLSAAMSASIADAPQAASPLYLRALLEELRVFGEHERVAERCEYYLAAPDIPELYERILARYEEDYDRERPALVRDAFRLLWAARRGLTESEMLDLLGQGGGPLPQALWSPFHLAAESALVNRGGLIGFAHQYFRDAVTGRYLRTETERITAHLELARYFESRPLSARQVEELPWQLVEAGEWERLAGLLVTPRFLEEAVKANQFDVMTYWAQVEANSPVRMVDTYAPVIDAVTAAPIHAWWVGYLLGNASHPEEALAVHSGLAEHYRSIGDEASLQASLGNQALILAARGDLDSAMALHKEEERICRALGNQNGLVRSFGNQALILYARGDLDGAMALYKEAERICRALGNQDGLQFSLDNQAVILSDRGDLDSAMALHKEGERICRALGNQDGLRSSLGNQANILAARGDLDSAMALHKEEERICRALGNQNGLEGSFGNQALILHARGDLDGAMALHKEQERICRALGNQDGLQTSLGNQAVILYARGDLDGAMVLHKEAERICRALGHQRGLAISLVNQAEIELQNGQRRRALNLAEQAFSIASEHGFARLTGQIQPILDAARGVS